jgi:sugar/nucleoside kinase (ribokinase family)
VCSGRALHLDGYEGDAALQAARWAREAGIPVSVDAQSFTERRDELFRLTDILIVAERYGRDVFHGAFLYGLLQGWEARHILLFANAVSALKCTRLGGRTGIPRVDEVLEFLRLRGEHIPAGALGKET